MEAKELTREEENGLILSSKIIKLIEESGLPTYTALSVAAFVHVVLIARGVKKEKISEYLKVEHKKMLRAATKMAEELVEENRLTPAGTC